MARRTHDAKRAVLTFLDRNGDATVAQIAEALGPDWVSEKKRVLLRQMLGQMVRAKLLIRVRYGVYRASPGHRLLGIDRFAITEDSIRDFLQSIGRAARAKEIYEAIFGFRDWRTTDRTADHVFMHRVLRESALFRHVGQLWAIA
jgi:hypothetical protein